MPIPGKARIKERLCIPRRYHPIWGPLDFRAKSAGLILRVL
jgi:hypothetical protein